MAKLERATLSLEASRGVPLLERLWREDDGQDLIEYGLLVALIALASVGASGSLATAISQVFSSAAGNLTSAS